MAIHLRPPVLTNSITDQYAFEFKKNSKAMITNVETEVGCCDMGNTTIMPFTVNNTEYENSYVCSPYTMLVPYCIEELHKLDNRVLSVVIKQVLRLLDRYVKHNNINRIVHINNWLLSTNLYPCVEKLTNIDVLLNTFSHHYKSHSLVFRSLNTHLNKELLSKLTSLGCIAVPTRQVYLYDKQLKDYSKTHNYKIDKKLLENTHYQYVAQSDIKESDYNRIIELYNMLYVDKYSKYNPQFTSLYITSIIKSPYFFIEGFRNKHGILDAVGGRFTIGSTTSLPIVGYDTKKPKHFGLYRLVLISTLLYAEKNNLCFNASSGAAHFKRLRGASPDIEYSMVYVKHLSNSSQRFWKIVAFILNKIFIPIMKKYKL